MTIFIVARAMDTGVPRISTWLVRVAGGTGPRPRTFAWRASLAVVP